MKIVEQTQSKLVVESDDAVFAWVLLADCVGLSAIAAWRYIDQPRVVESESFKGLVAGAIIFLIGFLAVYERARFVFDRGAGLLLWRRRRAWLTRSGTIPFQQIETVLAQPNLGKGGQIPKWRVVAVLPQEKLPISVAYAPDSSGDTLVIAETIRQFAGLPLRDPLMTGVREAVSKGDDGEAVRLLREWRFSPAAARRVVEHVRRPLSGGA